MDDVVIIRSRFVQEIKIISRYRDCLKILRMVMCKDKDLAEV